MSIAIAPHPQFVSVDIRENPSIDVSRAPRNSVDHRHPIHRRTSLDDANYTVLSRTSASTSILSVSSRRRQWSRFRKIMSETVKKISSICPIKFIEAAKGYAWPTLHPRIRTWHILMSLLAFCIVLCLLYQFFHFSGIAKIDVTLTMVKFAKRIEKMGFHGYLFVILLIQVWEFLGLPINVMEVMAGKIFHFPSWSAVIITSIGKLLGSTSTFLLSRFCCKHRIQQKLDEYYRDDPIFKYLNAAVHENEVKILFLSRVMYGLPAVIKNGAMATLHVSLSNFCLAAFIGDMPHTLFWLYVGSKTESLMAVARGNIQTSYSAWFAALGFSITAFVFIWLVRTAKKQLEKNLTTATNIVK